MAAVQTGRGREGMPLGEVWLAPAAVWQDPPGRFEPLAVRVMEGRISALVGRDEVPEGGSGVAIIDLPDHWLMPGLVNTHVHLEFSATALPLAEYRQETPAERLMRAIGNAHRLLRSGVTTARDCGSSRMLLTLARRPDISLLALPRLLLSGPPITVKGGHLHMMGGEAETEAEILALIEALAAAGATSLKAMASGGGMTPGTHPERATYDLRRLSLIAGEARRRRLPSAAHALATESIRRAAAAGFDSIEHCAFFERTGEDRLERRYDEAAAREVVASGAVVMAGLSTAYRPIERIERDGPRDEAEAFASTQTKILLDNFRRMADLGVRFVCGSDAGVKHTPFEETWLEIALMARSGLGPLEALRAATTRAAEALLLGNHVGRIAVGYSADLIALRENPLSRPEAFADVDLVMREGIVVHRAVVPAVASAGA